ncbi:hypothetical protein GCM10022223_62680 [Kineosporia mesophila]|uniref:PD-(D/E)XK endonuclease-like domain-containing protein n=1 Tax=Kineosporia mesophila TaxID=566012 RepID=A0ABP7ALZ6_9ACTN
MPVARPEFSGATFPRDQMRSELADLQQNLRHQVETPSLPGEDNDQVVALRRTRHVVNAFEQLLDEHPIGPDGRCRRCRWWQACPAAAAVRVCVTGWLSTGGLAERREGDPGAVSTRRL